jgi:hypothetical protein
MKKNNQKHVFAASKKTIIHFLMIRKEKIQLIKNVVCSYPYDKMDFLKDPGETSYLQSILLLQEVAKKNAFCCYKNQ